MERKKLVLIFGNADIKGLHEVLTAAIKLEANVQYVDSDQISEFDGKDALLFLGIPAESIPAYLDYGDQMVGTGNYELTAILCTPEVAEDSPDYNAQVQVWAEPLLARVGEGGTWTDDHHDAHHLTGDIDSVAEKLCEAIGALFATAEAQPAELEEAPAAPAPSVPAPSKEESQTSYSSILAKAKTLKGKVSGKVEKPKPEIKAPAPKPTAPAPAAPAAAPTPKPAAPVPKPVAPASAPKTETPAPKVETPKPKLGARKEASAPAALPVGPEVNLTVKMVMNGALVPVNIVINVAELKKALGI